MRCARNFLHQNENAKVSPEIYNKHGDQHPTKNKIIIITETKVKRESSVQRSGSVFAQGSAHPFLVRQSRA